MMTTLCAGFAGLALMAFAPADTDGEAPKSADAAKHKSLDDELLEGLGEGLDEVKHHKNDAKSPRKQPSGNALDEELLRGLGEGGLGEGDEVDDGGQDPLAGIGGRMRQVERRIAKTDAGEDTQAKQREIADELAKLIRDLQRQCQACKQASSKSAKSGGRGKVSQPELAGQPSDKPARDSSNRLVDRRIEKPDTAAMREMVKAAWGHLPEHLRPEMLQSAKIEFLPEYLMMIEDYFKALAKPDRR